MKKGMLAACALLLALGLCACGGKKPDGVYTAQADDAYVMDSGYGWRDTLTVTYEGGKVASAVFESYDAEGNRKSVAQDYDMEPSPTVWVPQLNENLAGIQSSDEVDTIAGATESAYNAKQMFEAIEKEGKAGETISIHPKPPA